MIETFTDLDGNEYVVIEHADGSFTSTSKVAYDLSQVEHLTEIPTPDEA